MIVETALDIAGQDSHLAARPAGVTHVYVGPLTPSGRFTPRNRRPVCGARTRRLTVTPPPRPSLDPSGPGVPRLCARCSTRLAARRHLPPGDAAGRVEPHTRDAYRLRYGHLTELDLYCAARTAETAEELDVVAHLSLLLFGHRACDRMVDRPDGTKGTSLHALIGRARRHLEPADPARREQYAANRDLVNAGRLDDLHTARNAELAFTGRRRTYRGARP